jgi:aryl-alcohol dehydrogenase (NADP+)
LAPTSSTCTRRKVRYIGCSNYTAWRVAEALGASERLGLTRYETIQPRYNLLYREIETELLPLARAMKLSVLVYNPLAGGFLTGKYQRGESPREGTRFTLGGAGRVYQHRYWDDIQFEAVETLRKEADARGFSLTAVAIAWVLRQPAVTSAIFGASRPDQLDAVWDALEVDFDDELAKVCDTLWWRLPRRPVAEGYR